MTHLALTKLDVLDTFDRISVCTGYAGGSERSLPFAISSGVKPIYETLPGWGQATDRAHAWEDLPRRAHEYVSFIQDAAGIPVSWGSVGPERSQIIVRRSAPINDVAKVS